MHVDSPNLCELEVFAGWALVQLEAEESVLE